MRIPKWRSLAGLAGGAAMIGAVACSSSPEEADFTVRIENISPAYDFVASGVAGDGPAGPGGNFTFEFDAAPGHSLSFATMFVPSNDFFYAPGESGIALYDSSGNPVTGDVTDQVSLWDAGTEADQELGAGSEQPLIGGPDPSTPDSNTAVRLAADAEGNLPSNDEVINVNLESLGGTKFRATINNVSTESTLQITSGGSSAVPLTPAVWVVHSDPAPLFTVGQPDRGEGLEVVAESGGADMLVASVTAKTGITSPLAPGAFVVHTENNPIFTQGQPDRGQGLEGLAEDGGGDTLAGNLEDEDGVSTAGSFAVTENTGAGGPALPGDAYTFTFSAEEGESLSFATMWVQSNDLFFAPTGRGIELFGDTGTPLSGDITSLLQLWDAGTEMNEPPGVGPNQAPRQSAAGAGTAESAAVMPVSDGYSYPDPVSVIRVTITPSS